MTTKFAPGLPEDAYLPKQEGPVPLVVLVPGGSWTTADPAGLAGLAADLAASCIAAAPTHIRVAEGGVAYPAPVDDCSPSCDSPTVRPDALVGLSGPYDISQIPDVVVALPGSSTSNDPEAWSDANPVERADLRPDVPVLLLHGVADDTVPVASTTRFAEALKVAGHPTTVPIVPRADHQTIYLPDVAGDRVATRRDHGLRFLTGITPCGDPRRRGQIT